MTHRHILPVLALFSLLSMHCAASADGDDAEVSVDPSVTPAALIQGGGDDGTDDSESTTTSEKKKKGGTEQQEYLLVKINDVLVSSY